MSTKLEDLSITFGAREVPNLTLEDYARAKYVKLIREDGNLVCSLEINRDGALNATFSDPKVVKARAEEAAAAAAKEKAVAKDAKAAAKRAS